MKRVIGFALVLAVLVTAFSACITTVFAETEPKFVIDGNLDVWYLSNDETPSSDLNYYHYISLDAYNKDPANGNGVYIYDDCETAAEVYMAYDDTYVYVYVKCWDEDIAIFSGDTAVSAKSDSIEVWFDPDPNSQTTKPDGTPNVDENGNHPNFPMCTQDPEQGDVRFRMRAADFAVGDTVGIVKPNYGGVTVSEYYRDTQNLRGFFFENEPRETANGDVLTSGYGLEVRLPRYDATGGNAFRVNVACNNRQGADQTEWYALAMGHSWWLDYSTANQVIYPKSGNPFFDQDVSKKTTQYTESESNAAGIAVKNAIAQLPSNVTVLEKQQVLAIVEQYQALDDVQKGYVKARNFDILQAAAKKLDIPLEGETIPDPETPTDVPLGDLNGDDKVDAKDALNVLKISVNKLNPTDEQKIAADVNKDNAINAKDALEILKKSVGKEACF